MPHSFHLSLPVKDYLETKNFYAEALGGTVEKETASWFNVNLYGHQLTFHVHPNKLLDNTYFHFGINVEYNLFYELFKKLQSKNTFFELLPQTQHQGQSTERVKMVFCDPNGYKLEFKAYKNPVQFF